MLVEITLGIGQIFMSDGAKHRAQSYQSSQRLRVPATHLLISCLLSFTVLSFYPKTNRQRCRWDTKFAPFFRHVRLESKMNPVFSRRQHADNPDGEGSIVDESEIPAKPLISLVFWSSAASSNPQLFLSSPELWQKLEGPTCKLCKIFAVTTAGLR